MEDSVETGFQTRLYIIRPRGKDYEIFISRMGFTLASSLFGNQDLQNSILLGCFDFFRIHCHRKGKGTAK